MDLLNARQTTLLRWTNSVEDLLVSTQNWKKWSKKKIDRKRSEFGQDLEIKATNWKICYQETETLQDFEKLKAAIEWD